MQEKIKKVLITGQYEFADAVSVMYAPQKGYVMNVIPLMLEHAWQQKITKQTTASEELMFSGWIGRLITLDNRVLSPDTQHEIAGWPVIRDQLINCLDECKDKSGLPKMLRDCMAAIQPILESRFEVLYHFPKKKFHCWWYTIHEENTKLALHLINAYQPYSPFDHLNHFLTTMLQAVEQALIVYPDIKMVSCGSWLNQLQKFQALWPAGFSRNQKLLNETGGSGPGAWGQYMTTTGGFNESKAAILRETGKHPYALTEAQSPVREVTAHLKKIIIPQ